MPLIWSTYSEVKLYRKSKQTLLGSNQPDLTTIFFQNKKCFQLRFHNFIEKEPDIVE